MKLLLDTTYHLPAIGISIKGLPKDAPLDLTRRGWQICISEISIFELSAKGAKYVASGALPPERVTRGIRALTYDESTKIIPPYDSTILLIAFKLRTMLDDFIDCLILASALHECDALLTEDSDIHTLKKERGFIEIFATINPKFKIQNLAEIL